MSMFEKSFKFRSPINRETSFSTTPLANDVESEIEGKELVDRLVDGLVDGVFELPKQLVDHCLDTRRFLSLPIK